MSFVTTLCLRDMRVIQSKSARTSLGRSLKTLNWLINPGIWPQRLWPPSPMLFLQGTELQGQSVVQRKVLNLVVINQSHLTFSYSLSTSYEEETNREDKRA